MDLCGLEASRFLPDPSVATTNIADLEGPFQIVKNIPGKGRGIKAVNDIPSGGLIMVSRAFAMVSNFKQGGDSLFNAIAKKLIAEPHLRSEIYKLDAGKKLGHLSPLKTPQPVVAQGSSTNEVTENVATPPIDMVRIAMICKTNCFGTTTGNNFRGLWILPSYLNHDCIDFNCNRKCFGDLLFIRATRDISKGEELLISYVDACQPFEKRLEFFKFHNFICECRLCVHEKGQDAMSKERKAQILQSVKELSTTIDGGDDPGNQIIQKRIECMQNFIEEYEKIGMASGKPEWNFTICILLKKLQTLYEKAGNLEMQRSTGVKYYEVVNGCGQKDGGGSICLDIGAARRVVKIYIKLGDLEKAKYWLSILKKDLSTVYGKSDVLKELYPNLYSAAVKNGIEV